MQEKLWLRIGNWEDTIGLYFDECHIPTLERYGLGVGGGRGMTMGWLPSSRGLGFIFCDDGGYHIGKATDCDFWKYRVTFHTHVDVARFAITEMPFLISEAGIYTNLPLDHVLPWPQLNRCGSLYDPAEVARREIKLRAESAARCGVPFTLAGIPAEFQSIITPAERVRIYEEARAP